MSLQAESTGWRYAALAAAIVSILGVAGCGKKAPPAAATAPAAAGTAAPAAATAATGGVVSDADLLAKARAAENEKRYYAPAGDNAIEYYLQLRARNPKDASVTAALTDLFPYAMIATEQSLKKGDEPGRVEAARIFALLERVDANAPSLPRLRTEMQQEAATELKQQQDEAKKAQDVLEKKAEEDKARQAAATAAAARPAAAPPPDLSAASRPARPQAQNPAPAPAAAAPPPAPVAAAPAPKPEHKATPEPVTTAQPAYPREALRDQVSGEVTVSFTVNPDGSVGNASVVSSNPRRVFDRAALDAIRKWKFTATGESTQMQRTFAFNPGN